MKIKITGKMKFISDFEVELEVPDDVDLDDDEALEYELEKLNLTPDDDRLCDEGIEYDILDAWKTDGKSEGG